MSKGGPAAARPPSCSTPPLSRRPAHLRRRKSVGVDFCQIKPKWRSDLYYSEGNCGLVAIIPQL
jgi:hypothetical protein